MKPDEKSKGGHGIEGTGMWDGDGMGWDGTAIPQ